MLQLDTKSRRNKAEPDVCWYAVHVQSNFEQKVAAALCAKGIETYLPHVSEVHQWKDRKKTVEVPLFPGYLFLRFADTDQARLRVACVRGVVRILGQGDAIEAIPEAEIEAVRRLLQTNRGFRHHPLLVEGAVVRVKRGPLKGVEGVLARIKNESRLVVSINALSRSLSTEIDVSAVELLGSPRKLEARVA